jgi:xylose isomerase
MAGIYRFSFGPWNIHEGADPFGPTVRETIPFAEKLKQYKALGFDGVQFHDDDAVPDLNQLSDQEVVKRARQLKTMLDGEGLVAEFVAPRLWEDPRTIDGGYTSNDPKSREYARVRTRRAIDIADALGTSLIVLWLAREGTYIRESKDSKIAVDRIVAAVDDMLAYHPSIRIAVSQSRMSRWTTPIYPRPATRWRWLIEPRTRRELASTSRARMPFLPASIPPTKSASPCRLGSSLRST